MVLRSRFCTWSAFSDVLWGFMVETDDLSLLLGLELLVQLSQAGCTIVVGITAWDQVRRAGHGLGAGCLNAGMTCLLSFVDHLSRGGDRGIVVLEIHEDS